MDIPITIMGVLVALVFLIVIGTFLRDFILWYSQDRKKHTYFRENQRMPVGTIRRVR